MGSFQDSVETIIDSWLRGNVHTVMPGIIEEITDREVPLASVQPALMRVREGTDTGQPLPTIPDVPIVFPSFGAFGIVSNIDKGTPVLLITSERSIATWMNEGGVVDPKLNRMFDISDCFAIPGLVNFGNPLAEELPGEGISIRKHDGTVAIKIKSGQIELHNEEGSVTIEENGSIEVSNVSGSLTLKDDGQVDANGNLTVDP